MVTSFIDKIDSLPKEVKQLYLSAYKKANKDNTSYKSAQIAWALVKRQYSKRSGKWIQKQNIQIITNIKKAGFLSPTYSIDLIIGSTAIDNDKQRVSKNLLSQLYSQNLIDNTGDIDHLDLTHGEDYFTGLFRAAKKYYKDGMVRLKVIVDKTHEAYKWFIDNKIYNNIKGASAEYINPVVIDGEIVHADYMGWTVALKKQPTNPDSMLRK